ncbi:DegV domain-containing protein [subsurface metagenome]
MQDPENFNTSPASPVDYLEAYREASAKAESILCITLSSKLSTGYNVARLAKEQAEAELPGILIEVLDSQSVTAAEGFIALAAARAAAEGKDLAEVVKVAEEVKDKVTFLLVLDTIRHVYRTGRIPKVASQIGSMLNIKPMLTISAGLVRFKGIVRNREQGINRILREMREKVGQSPMHVAVMHAYAPDEAERLKERIASEFNCAELWVTGFSLVMGYATGTGTLGFAYYSDD